MLSLVAFESFWYTIAAVVPVDGHWLDVVRWEPNLVYSAVCLMTKELWRSRVLAPSSLLKLAWVPGMDRSNTQTRVYLVSGVEGLRSCRVR